MSGCSTAKKTNAKDIALLHLQNGTRFFTNKKYPSALTEFLAAEKLDPRNAVVQNNLALTYFVRDRMELAQKHIDLALSINPSYTEARNNRARILIERGQFALAIQDAKKVTEDLTYQYPIRGWTNIALAQFRMGNFKDAKATATEALKVDRTNCFAQTVLGRSHLEISEFKEAAETLDRAISACRTEGEDEAAYFAGVANYKLGRSAAAIARLEEVLKDYPQGRYAKKAESLLEIMR
ncbi:MAG: tetratricopeptide repeat protein [Bdellovibrionales bacterium]|nr:tetratricopeptide repeat protein [Bdellovibrionales bacterium]